MSPAVVLHGGTGHLDPKCVSTVLRQRSAPAGDPVWRTGWTVEVCSDSSNRLRVKLQGESLNQHSVWSQCPAHIAQIIANDGLQVICSCCHWFVQQSRITSCTNMFTKLQSVPSSLMMWNCRSVLINTAVFSDCGGGDCRPN